MEKIYEKKDTLLLITSHFPFNGGESFLETEIGYLQRCFKQIIIVSRDIESNLTRELHQDIKCFRYNPSSKFKDYLFLPFLLISNSKNIRQSFISEITLRRNRKEKITCLKLKVLFRAITKALQLKHFILKIISTVSPEENIILYSYWMNSGAHAIAFMKSEKLFKITRAHRGDLYEESSEKGILPLQLFTCSNVDHVFLISENGIKYLKSHLNVDRGNLSVSRLGVTYRDVIIPFCRQKHFTIVSCSNLSPVKRVDIIIKAISMVNTPIPIHWFHFGDGALMDDLLRLAKESFRDNNKVEWHFYGAISNKNILDFYNNNNIDLFINTSSSEGLPVSIMEAQIFGIPVIATDCGGTREIVGQETGTLIPVDSTIEDFAHAIENFINLEENEYLAMRQRIIKNQQMNFSAEENYSSMTEKIRELTEHIRNNHKD
jgi:colanic acid/amylovoran biosynthesis glycosyltransferase